MLLTSITDISGGAGNDYIIGGVGTTHSVAAMMMTRLGGEGSDLVHGRRGMICARVEAMTAPS